MAGRRIVVYPGSFDPVTRGHLDLVARGVKLFDRLVVAVMVNPEKTPLLPVKERLELIAREVRRYGKVKVRSHEGLVVQLAEEVGAGWILRGVRSEADLGQELNMAHSNRLCGTHNVETVFLPALPELSFISSRLVRDIARLGGDLRPFVTPAVARSLKKACRERGEKKR